MLVDGCRLLQLFFCFIPKYVKRNPTSLSRIKTKILLLLLDILDETLLCFAYHYTQITKMIFSHILFLKVFCFFMSLKQIWSKQTKQKQAIPPSPFRLKKKKEKEETNSVPVYLLTLSFSSPSSKSSILRTLSLKQNKGIHIILQQSQFVPSIYF